MNSDVLLEDIWPENGLEALQVKGWRKSAYLRLPVILGGLLAEVSLFAKMPLLSLSSSQVVASRLLAYNMLVDPSEICTMLGWFEYIFFLVLIELNLVYTAQ